MDEENDLPLEGGEVETHVETTEEHTDPVEAIAMELGWSPKEKWRGDEADWKPAQDFLKTTVEVNKASRKEIKALRDSVERVSRTSEVLLERRVAEEREKLERQFAEAVDLGDHDAARRASAKLNTIQQPVEDPAMADFKARNANWFTVDPIATDFAVSVGGRFQNLPTAQQIAKVEEEVRKRFPEYFEAPKQAKPPAQVSESGRMASSPVSRKRGYAELPLEAKKAADMWERKGVTKEQFAQEYWKENA